MVATGAGVGIAVTFGAPVGGVIFAYEITRNTAFWTSGTFFRCLTASTVGVYFYTLLWQIRLGDIQHVITTGILPLSLIDTVPTFHMGDIFVWILIGIGCAIMGSVFNGVSNFCNSLWMQYMVQRHRVIKIIECICWAIIPGTVFFTLPGVFPCVNPLPGDKYSYNSYSCIGVQGQ